MTARQLTAGWVLRLDKAMVLARVFAFTIALVTPFRASAATCDGPPDPSGLHTDFEDGGPDGWTPRIGEERLIVTPADAHSGSLSLLITGRQHAFSGPSIDATGKMCNGSRYVVSLWAKLAPGEADTELRLSLLEVGDVAGSAIGVDRLYC